MQIGNRTTTAQRGGVHRPSRTQQAHAGLTRRSGPGRVPRPTAVPRPGGVMRPVVPLAPSNVEPSVLTFAPPVPGPRPRAFTPPVPGPLLLAGLPQSPADVQGLRRELEGFAQRCRAFADVCEETSRRIEGIVHPPAPRKSPEKPRAARAQDTLPELGAFDIVEVEVSLDWNDEDEPTAVWVQAQGPAVTWEQPVVSAQRSPTVPPAVMRPCPSCGHGNGRQYSCCTACGCRLSGTEPDRQLEETVVLNQTLGSRVRTWLRRMDPRRPRWLDPDVLESVEMPAMQ